jgi:thioredoxin reductase (NADPH)
MELLIVGDGQCALEQAVHHAQPGPDRAARVTLMHRRDDFKADPQTVLRMREAVANGALRLLIAQITGLEHAQGRLHAVHALAADGSAHQIPLDALLVLLGLSPKLGPIAEWGLAMERKQLVVDTERFETSVPGIFAVGDVNTYPGKQKLILCGFHEATLAAFAAAHHVYPTRPVRLEYTTTSTRLHRALRLDGAV